MSREQLVSAGLAALCAVWLVVIVVVGARYDARVERMVTVEVDMAQLLPMTAAAPTGPGIAQAAELYWSVKGLCPDPVASTLTVLGYDRLDDTRLGQLARVVLAEHVASAVDRSDAEDAAS